MIRCVHLWTGDDQESHFEEGVIELDPGQRGDFLTDKLAVSTISFQETASGGSFAWHTAPARQLVITLSGTLDFQPGAVSTSCCTRAISCLPKTPLGPAIAGS